MRRFITRLYQLLAGVAILGVSVVGMVHGARAGVAELLYGQTKFGDVHGYPRETRLSATFRRAEAADRLYPWNYWFCVWVAEMAWYERFDLLRREDPECLKMASYWCDRGLGMNPYKSQLRLLKARLLERESPVAAVKYWEQYVDWQFWEPYNHAVLAEFRARSGDYIGALESLDILKGSTHHDYAQRMIDEAWQSDLQGPKRKASALPVGAR